MSPVAGRTGPAGLEAIAPAVPAYGVLQRGGCDRLGQVGVEPRVLAARDLLSHRRRADRDDGPIDPARTQGPAELVAIQTGHLDIEDDEVEYVLERAVEATTAIAGHAHGVPVTLEHVAEELEVHRVVVDDEDSHRPFAATDTGSRASQRARRARSI